MSDENSHEFMVKRIGELERHVAETTAEAKKRRLEKRKVEQERDELAPSGTGWSRSTRPCARPPREWQQKAEDLERQIRGRDHRDAWREVIGPELAEPRSPSRTFGPN